MNEPTSRGAPTADIAPQRISIDALAGEAFPVAAFEHEDPATHASPILRVKSPWVFEVETLEVTGQTDLRYGSMGHLWGLTLSNGTDATNDIDIAAGEAVDNSDGTLMVASALTKQLDAAWAVGTNQGGLDTGSIANAWYAMWLIKRTDTGIVDALFSLSATAPTMPTGYTKKRRIGWIYRTGGAIKPCVWVADRCLWKALVNDRAIAAIPNTNRNLQTLTAAPNTAAILEVIHQDAGATASYWIRPTSYTDAAASATHRTGAAAARSSYEMEIEVDSSSQIAYRGDTTNLNLQFETAGFIDTRGRLA